MVWNISSTFDRLAALTSVLAKFNTCKASSTDILLPLAAAWATGLPPDLAFIKACWYAATKARENMPMPPIKSCASTFPNAMAAARGTCS
eukprot:CAMPEP_0118967726 /NCGR_PEP_ID=MMETSP1173-20130426/5071_1 /TAXON_ID=1034831 /ORGANISM="Rhizochromulina marina cf, Strain CCMP1243" /LENGTH=89 /DNA_ID=CAMNT_0006916743 /DNA_START=148 /DNA_END=413 /DNA_ORIENTATION=+